MLSEVIHVDPGVAAMLVGLGAKSSVSAKVKQRRTAAPHPRNQGRREMRPIKVIVEAMKEVALQKKALRSHLEE